MHNASCPLSAYDPERLAAELIPQGTPLLVYGAVGSGKSTLTASLLDAARIASAECQAVSADPGTPAFGPPGAVARAQRSGSAWQVLDLEGLCTLDAARGRLPLVASVQRLLARGPQQAAFVIDAPGLVAARPAEELLEALIRLCRIQTVLVLTHPDQAPPQPTILDGTAVSVVRVAAAPQARPPGRSQRRKQRTRRWDDYLARAKAVSLSREAVAFLGTAPGADVRGQQVALLDASLDTLALGEVEHSSSQAIRVRAPLQSQGAVTAVRLGDARRNAQGQLSSAAKGSTANAPRLGQPVDADLARPLPRRARPEYALPQVSLSSCKAVLLNGLFGDPALHVRFRHASRSLLFDLGDIHRLGARILHQVSEVFVSHAHLDHIGDFLWLLRNRIGCTEVCRIYGPPGLSRHIRNLVEGILWDRIGPRGPRFEIAELHGEELWRWHLHVGSPALRPLPTQPAGRGLVVQTPAYRVRAARLEHGVPVLAFALEETRRFNVRKDALRAAGFPPGRWLTRLRRKLQAGELDARVQCPDGRRRRARDLQDAFMLSAPGQKLVYATDFADTEANKAKVLELARDARHLICEAAFRQCDRHRARASGHLTTRACAEIARAARVQRLTPFHFSKRYEDAPREVYAEIRAHFPHLTIPRAIAEQIDATSASR